MKHLNVGLESLQSKTIGIAEINGDLELVTEQDSNTFVTQYIGRFGGLKTSFYPRSEFQYECFPPAFKNLSEFLKQPIQFHNWIKEYFPNI